MLPATHKVTKQLFKPLLSKGRSFHSDTFSFRVFFAETPTVGRFSVVVPKKLEKSAVERNKMKRRIYSVLRPYVATAKKGVVGAFFLKKKVQTKTLPALRLEVASLLAKARVLV